MGGSRPDLRTNAGVTRRGEHALAVCVCVLAILGGCSSNRTADRTVQVGAGQYAEAFDAAREVLRSYKFTLARVDARSGVITTEPRFSYGIASPFDPVQSTPRQHIQDFMNQQDRRVRITFSQPGDASAVGSAPAPPADAAPTDTADAPADGASASAAELFPPDGLLLDGSSLPALGADLRAAPGPLVMHVDVVIDRVSVPHRRLETSSIRQSTFAQEPDLISRGMQPTYSVSKGRDDALAARLADEVRRRLASAE